MTTRALGPRRIGLVPGAFKPYHRGHDAAVRLAADECDEVRVLASLADRARKGEVAVTGDDMERVWRELVEPGLPPNVTVQYLRGSAPINVVWATLGSPEAEGSDDVYVVYSDQDDLSRNFKDSALDKYAGVLRSTGRLELRATPRITSATAVRKAIGTGDFAAFAAEMPGWLDARRAWAILAGPGTRVEALVRTFVREALA